MTTPLTKPFNSIVNETEEIPESSIKNGLAANAGAIGALFAHTTGLSTALHEVVGHGLLGFKTVYKYASGQGPHYWVLGWDNFREMFKAGSFKEWITDFFQWISSSNAKGIAGWANRGHPSGYTPAGQAMGTNGSSAWISLAGSLPGLALDSLAVVGGMCVRKRSPKVGSALVGMGLTDNLLSSVYPIDAALMSEAQLRDPHIPGHDFANFAVRMSNILHVPAQAIAISTAAIWSGFVPLLALGTYLHTKSHATDAVPTKFALKQWLSKAKTDPKLGAELKNHFSSFPGKAGLEALIRPAQEQTKEKARQIRKYTNDFLDYLGTQIPTPTIEKIKGEILESWAKQVKPDPWQAVFTGVAVISAAASVATKCLQVLSETVAPNLATAATVLTDLSPLFLLAATASTGYQVYKDLSCPDSVVPHSAKMVSIAILVTSVARVVLIAVALFVPGLNGLFVGALFLGTIANVTLSFARLHIIRQQFQKTHPDEPLWNPFEAFGLMVRDKNSCHLDHAKINPLFQRWLDRIKPIHNLIPAFA